MKKQVLNQSKRVVLVWYGSQLRKDLRLLKEKVRFNIGSRNKQLNNGAQGISGGCADPCNRNFKLVAVLTF